MTTGWKQQTLDQVCEFLNRGISPKYLTEGGVRVLNQRCIRDHEVNFEPSRRHDVARKSVSEDRFVRGGDVLINSTGTGTLGRVAQMRADPKEPTTVDSHVTIARPKSGLFDPAFFGYMLIVIEDEIKEAGEGCGGQTELARSTLADQFFVNYPTSISEQKRLVRILDEAFEGIATAKANTEENLDSARDLFDSEVHALFAKRGDGWVEETVDGLATNLDSKRVPITKSDRKSGEYPYYGASGIVDYVDKCIFEGPALLISEDGANLLARSTPIAFSVSGKYWVNNHAHVLRFEKRATQRFVEFYLESIKIDEFITGTAQPKLTQKALNSISIPIPQAIGEQAKIVDRIERFQSETNRLEDTVKCKLAALDDLKRSLLHQAFTGQL